MAGKIVIDTLQDGSGNSTSATDAIKGSAKAWVNFDGSTAAIRAGYNVSSVTKSATGKYTINFTNALLDTNYSLIAVAKATYDTSGNALTVCGQYLSQANATTSVAMQTKNHTADADANTVYAAIFR